MAKLSDPGKKKKRESPAYRCYVVSLTASEEGRELFIVNIDFDATEDDLRRLLAEVTYSLILLMQHGEIQSLKLLTARGEKKHNGRAFVVYSRKEEADSALALNGTKFITRVLKVQRSDPQHSTQPRS
jgi:squamous cell carcinoma antigen recognized by T-cells 3